MFRKPAAAVGAALALGALLTLGAPQQSRAADCPNGGTVRFGVEPFETAAKLQPLYDAIGQMLAQKLGCKVEVYVATSYNAEIEAMRAGKLELGEFGPLGYILAHQIAHAQAVSTFATDGKGPATYYASIVTTPGSGITTMKQVAGRSFAFSDPDSTSGHLFPAYALRKSGIDPDTGVKGVYAGSHTASYEAIKNKKVEAGELNSQIIDAATATGNFNASDFVTLWKSDPIPTDPIAIRADLPDSFKARVGAAFKSMDITSLDPNNILKGFGHKFVTVNDSLYQPIRDLVSTLHIDLTKL